MRIAVLALQGAFAEHRLKLAQLGQLSYFQMMKGLNKAYHEEVFLHTSNFCVSNVVEHF